MHACATGADRANPERCRVSDRFGAAAARLGGQVALLLGWLPDTFWSATPEELGSVLSAIRQPEGEAIDKRTLDRLMEQDRDG